MTDKRSGYFALHPNIMRKNYAIIDPGPVDDTIIITGTLDLNKYYEVISIEAGFDIGCEIVIGDPLACCNIDIENKGTVKEISAIYPLKELKFEAFRCGTTDSGLDILHLNLKRHTIEQSNRLIRLVNQTDYKTQESKEILKIEVAFLGPDEQDVFDAYPEMEEVTTVDDVETRRLIAHSFAHDIWGN